MPSAEALGVTVNKEEFGPIFHNLGEQEPYFGANRDLLPWRRGEKTVPLGKVTGLTATTGSYRLITLNWNLLEGATSYEIMRTSSASNPGAVAPPYPDVSVAPATQYTYRVRGRNNAGEVGEYSDPANATSDPLPVPENVEATPGMGVTIDVTWDCDPFPPLQFRVFRRRENDTWPNPRPKVYESPPGSGAYQHHNNMIGLTMGFGYVYCVQTLRVMGFQEHLSDYSGDSNTGNGTIAVPP